MTIEYLEQQLEKWKRVLLLFLGAGLTLAASTFGITGAYTFSLGWVMVWIVLQLGTIPAGLLLLFAKDWRQLPLPQRLNTAFGFLGVGWLCWLALGFRISVDSYFPLAFILLLGAGLAIIYLLRRRAHTSSPEEIFP
jgi:hypothetical protein